jgi:hypothetical protein
MSDVVVDSSVIAKWFVPKTDSAQAQRVMPEVRITQNQQKDVGQKNKRGGVEGDDVHSCL